MIANQIGFLMTKKLTEITQAQLKRVVDYDPITGKFWWKERTAEDFPLNNKSRDLGWVARNWNSNYAGKEAFTALDSRGYHYGTLWHKRVWSHQLVFLWCDGELPGKGLEVDHINGIITDNSRLNLRIATKEENRKNMKRRSDNTTGHPGVYRNLDNPKNPWFARINTNGKIKHLGSFPTYEAALAARKEAEPLYLYHENSGRVVI